jgi:hypothetical protein
VGFIQPRCEAHFMNGPPKAIAATRVVMTHGG